MKIAVAWSHERSHVISRFGAPAPDHHSRPAAENVVGALRARGHDALLCEADTGLLQELARFIPALPDGQPGGIVFNMAQGIQGESRRAHVPAMLEMAGVPYSGAGPLGHALAHDKLLAKHLLREAGVATPAHRVLRTGLEDTASLGYPLVAKPLQGSNGFGVHLVGERGQLAPTVQMLAARYRQEVLVEEFVDGREICVALLGNGNPDVLPFVEHDFGIRTARIVTAADLGSRGHDEPATLCPARVGPELGRHLREAALAAFRVCRCRDHAFVCLRVDRAGRVVVLEVDPMPSLGVNAPYALAARTAGMSFPVLVERILEAAHKRIFGAPPAIPQEAEAEREPASDEHLPLAG
ncbi:MAG TPA: ATP-grasp domain-containing protein [Usitatibacter sp.]|nr:ATP-grasp domain-containing protein [Usitatibacter sp.]